MSNNWYYSKNGKQQFGPFNDTSFASLAKQGSVGPKDYVRTDAMKKWVLAENIKGIIFGSLPEISIPLSTPAKKDMLINNPLGVNLVASAASQESNETSKTPPLNKEPLEKQKPVNTDVKNAGGGISTTMLAAGAGAAIGLGVGALLGNSMSSGSRGNSNIIDSQGLNQRLKTLNLQGLLSDYDYQTILQLINNQPIGSSGRILPNHPKKRHLTSNSKNNNQSSSKNLTGADDSLVDETLLNGESDLDGAIEGKSSELDTQQEEEILDAEDVSSDMEDEDILDAEDLENEDEEELNTEEELDSSDDEDESDDEDIEDEDIEEDNMDDMQDEDSGGDDYSTNDSGGGSTDNDD